MPHLQRQPLDLCPPPRCPGAEGGGLLELLLTKLTHIGFNNLPKDLQAAAERLHDPFPGTDPMGTAPRVDPASAQANLTGGWPKAKHPDDPRHFLTEQESLALWDAIVQSIRPRPGAF